MMTTTCTSQAIRSGGSKTSDAVRRDDLVRLLVEQVEAACPPLPHGDPHSGREEIIVDTELDGSRYLLVRMPRRTGTGVTLSPREQEIVRMVAQGHPNKVIADVLNISSWTVGTHLRRIFAKLGVGSRAAMVARFGAMASRGSPTG
jgi:DNA-binding CsgD family transcriptional regulator